MERKNLRSLAVLGLSTGILISAQQTPIEAAVYDKLLTHSMSLLAANTSTSASADKKDATDEDIQKKQQENASSYKQLTEDDLYGMVNSKTWALYESLSPEGKTLALNIASRSCDGSNDCRGQGACKDNKHNCAGQNECRGKSKCNVSDKNLAVKLAANIMAKKRGEAVQPVGADSQ
jgi:hypothetical protein